MIVIKNCIYRILNKINNKVYIGSTIDSERREIEHFSQLESGVHINIHLQRAYSKYGKDAFMFDVIESDLQDGELIKKEQHYINLFNSSNESFGYNISKYANRPDGRKYIKIYTVNLRNVIKECKLNVNSLALLFCVQSLLEPYTNRVSLPNGKNLTNKDLCNMIQISENPILLAIRELENENFIKRVGNGRSRKIYVNPNLMTAGTEIQQEIFDMFKRDGDNY